jgi:lysozyme
MQMSAAGIAILANREGVRTKAYKDTRGIWTIGVGHTSASGPPTVYPWSTITVAAALALFKSELATEYEAAIDRDLKRPVNQQQYDALGSFIYNIGTVGFAGSSVVRDINNGDFAAAADAFLLWEKPPELKSRREAERAQFISTTPSAIPVVTAAPEPTMAIALDDFFIHLGAQVATAAGTAIIAKLAGTDYSSLGAIAPAAQMGAAVIAEIWNTFIDPPAAPATAPSK